MACPDDLSTLIQVPLSKWDWFRQDVELPHGVPSHDTFGRVFARFDTSEFLTAMHYWGDQFARSLPDRGIAIDGKQVRTPTDEVEKSCGRGRRHCSFD